MAAPYRYARLDAGWAVLSLAVALILGIQFGVGSLATKGALIGGGVLTILVLLGPPFGSVSVEGGYLRLRRGWRSLEIPLEAIRSARTVDAPLRLSSKGQTQAQANREWRMTMIERRGVEIVFAPGLPEAVRRRLPCPHSFRVLFSDPDGLVAALGPPEPVPADRGGEPGAIP